MRIPDIDLTHLGLNAYESSTYLALLGRSGQSSTELATRAKVPRQRIYDVLRSLESKGLSWPVTRAPRPSTRQTPPRRCRR